MASLKIVFPDNQEPIFIDKELLEERFLLIRDYISDNPEAISIYLSIDRQTFFRILQLCEEQEDSLLSDVSSDIKIILEGAEYLMVDPYYIPIFEKIAYSYLNRENISFFPSLPLQDYARKIENPSYLSEFEEKYLESFFFSFKEISCVTF